MKRSVLIIVFLVLTIVVSSLAQGPLSSSLDEFYSYGDNYFLEITTLPGAVPNKGRAMVSFRLTYDLLSFRKAEHSYRKGNLYIAMPSVFVEAVASDGVISDRRLWRDTARVEEFSETNSKLLCIAGTIELELRPGMYTFKYTIEDGAPGQGFTRTVGPMKMDDFYSPSPAIGTPLFLRRATGDTLVAAAVDGNALYGQPIQVYVPLSSNEPPKSLRYELLSAATKQNATPQVIRAGFGSLLGAATLSPAHTQNGHLTFHLLRSQRDSGVSSHSFAALVTIPSGDLALDDYILTISYEAGYNSVIDSIPFSIIWEDMPISLSQADYAIRALYPITSDETIDLLLSGDKNRQQGALEGFWQSHDPTPTTRYNEAMVEYYRRVDYAFFNFKSLGQKDGVYTDRGKIYILYGSPSDVNRELLPDSSPREVWTYINAVSRRFIFVDESKTGEYRLVEYYDL